MKTVRFFGTFSFLIGIADLSLAAIALGTTWWRKSFADDSHLGLFETCTNTGCTSPAFSSYESYLRATQAFMCMGCFTLLVNLFVLLFITCKNGKRNLNKFAGMLFFLAGIFLMVACAVYTAEHRPTLVAANQSFGFSLWLAWASVIVTLLSAPFGFLAKDDEWRV